jgi:hypothetical protein
MTSITVFFHNGNQEVTFTDEVDKLFYTQLEDGHMRIMEALRLIPGSETGNFKTPRCIHIYPPGVWREVELDYGS